MAAMAHVFVGIKGTALAFARATGEEVWRSPLGGADFVNVVLVDGDLFATTRGELFALEPSTGKILWHNPLKGLGRGLVTVASGTQQTPMAEKKRRDAQAAAAASAGAAGA